MANPTTNFGWVMPTSTSLVTNLPADFNTFGQGVDTSMAQLKGGTTGQILSKTSATDMAFTWITPNPGDITGVTAGTGISGGGTSGDVTITNSMATAMTTKGDLVPATGSGTFSRLAVGTNGQTLVADSTASTGLKWATPSSGALTFISGASFSAVTSVSAPTNSFTSTYDNYKVIFSLSAATATAAVTLRMRASGSDDTAANYWWALNMLSYATTTRSDSVNNNQTSFGIGSSIGSSAADTMQFELTFINPKLAQKTQVNVIGSANAPSTVTGYMWYNTSAVHDAFSFLIASGNMTGYYKIYGYQNS